MVVFKNKKHDGRYYTIITKENGESEIFPCYIKDKKDRKWLKAKNNSEFCIIDNLDIAVAKESKKVYYKET